MKELSPEEFRKYSYRLADWIAEYFKNIDKIPPLTDVKPGEIRSKLPADPPVKAESFESVMKDIDKIIMPGMTHWNHPGFFAYFGISGSIPGILADLLSSAFNVNAMLWKTCPSATELEQVTLDWLGKMTGLPDKLFGIVYDTASIGALHAIAAAREELSDLEIREKGMSGRTDIPLLRIYISEQTHSSVEKAAIALGIGIRGVRKIPVNSDFQMIPELLKKAVEEDRENGYRPFFVVATVGTTSTTSIDPVEEIASICGQEKLWLHVDAAYGGSAAVVPEMRHILKGCEHADSIVINPQKWLFVPIDFSAFYTRKPEVLRRAFSLVPEYLKTPEDSEVDNLMDYSLQLGRRFRALKLWFVIRLYGADGIASLIRNHILLARNFSGWVEESSDFELMAPVPFSTVCFRANPSKTEDEGALNILNQKLMEDINRSKAAYLSHTVLNGKFVLRLAIGNIRTERRHIEQAWKIINNCLKKNI